MSEEFKLRRRSDEEARAFRDGAKHALRLCVESMRNRAASWAGPNVPNATQASIDTRAELLNEATAIEHWTAFDELELMEVNEDAKATLPT